MLMPAAMPSSPPATASHAPAPPHGASSWPAVPGPLALGLLAVVVAVEGETTGDGAVLRASPGRRRQPGCPQAQNRRNPGGSSGLFLGKYHPPGHPRKGTGACYRTSMMRSCVIRPRALARTPTPPLLFFSPSPAVLSKKTKNSRSQKNEKNVFLDPDQGSRESRGRSSGQSGQRLPAAACCQRLKDQSANLHSQSSNLKPQSFNYELSNL